MLEIEYIPIGEEANTGDAILIHFREPDTLIERVVLVDGGFNETAADIAKHVRRYYGVSRLDLVVCTHPDEDHINGLFGVFEELEVVELLIHQPSAHGFNSDEYKSEKVDELIALAYAKGASVNSQAFSGYSYFGGALCVIGPTRSYYEDLLGGSVVEASATSTFGGVIRAAVNAIRKALVPRSSDPGEGELSDNGGVTARNNSSVILNLQVGEYRALFTGDAGVPALLRAADYIQENSLGRAPFDFIDIPHHGSRHNLTTEVMDRLAGPTGRIHDGSAFVSVGKKAHDFPRAEVANAFKRRGYSVSPTRGQIIRWSRDADPRPDWVSLTPLPWLEPGE